MEAGLMKIVHPQNRSWTYDN